VKDRRLMKVHLDGFIIEEFGLETVKLLMEDFLVIEASFSLVRDGISYVVWHPDNPQVHPGCCLVESTWAFSTTVTAGHVVTKLDAELFLANGDKLKKTINFNRSVTLEKPAAAYTHEAFNV
jgi:hypothetical protein